MTTNHIPLPAIENAIREVCMALEENAYQLPSWTTMSEDNLWRELVACILGSRVRFEVAHSAVEGMERRGLFCKARRSSQFEKYEKDIMVVLSGVSEGGSQSRHPFFRMRANQIRHAAERLYGSRETIRALLENSWDIRHARRRLASEVSGLGPKQASLFLRNIGYTSHVAVLDVHVLTYMAWAGLTEAPMKSVSTLRKYEALEDVFIEHAYSFGYPPNRFDLAVWIVLRVVKEEQRTWG